MKDLFPGHFREPDSKIKDIWHSSVYIFDANILLNLYRYSDKSRTEFLDFISKIRDKVWIPHRVAEEYLSNRLTVIHQQESYYDTAIKSINELKGSLDNSRNHPFVSKPTMTKATSAFNELLAELEQNKNIHTKEYIAK